DGKRVDLGTVEVDEYIYSWRHSAYDSASAALDAVDYTPLCPRTSGGPHDNYRFALFVEKEGFDALFRSVHLADRWDVAIFSTKGMSVTAARRLVEKLSEHDVTILVLHDFDKSGLSILHTLRTDTRRYKFKTAPKVIDIGLRLQDARRMMLESEEVRYH